LKNAKIKKARSTAPSMPPREPDQRSVHASTRTRSTQCPWRAVQNPKPLEKSHASATMEASPSSPPALGAAAAATAGVGGRSSNPLLPSPDITDFFGKCSLFLRCTCFGSPASPSYTFVLRIQRISCSNFSENSLIFFVGGGGLRYTVKWRVLG